MRSGGFPNVKKDANLEAGKLIPQLLKLFNDDCSESVWEGACYLLCNILTSFPSSVHRHYDSLEAAIVSRIMSGTCSVNVLKKLAYCLGLLPKARRDEGCWSLMLQKIFYVINAFLNDAFDGLEEETKRDEAIRLLFPPGKDPPPTLGGLMMLKEVSDKATKKPEKLLLSNITSLMICCCTMLTSSYPVQVTVPVRPLLSLVGRVLRVDGSLFQSSLPFMTTMQQEVVCSQLPVLHLYSLELLIAIIKGVRSQLLPHAADIIRLLSEYFRRCALPELRVKVYSIIKILLISMGAGISVYLAPEVVQSAFVDLNSVGFENVSTSLDAYSNVSTEALPQINQKKRKHAATIDSFEAHNDVTDLEVEVPKNCPTTQIPVKIAALAALESLLTVGGALRTESWRPKIDLLLITVALNVCKGGWASDEQDIFQPDEPSSTLADFQLAALRALLASLLSPARVRPPYLAQGLELFRRGKQETGTRLAEFCAHALLALEVLIHPRALPMVEFPSVYNSFGVSQKLPADVHSGGQKHIARFSSGSPRNGPRDSNAENDDLYNIWKRTDFETEGPVAVLENDAIGSKDPSETFRDSGAEKLQVSERVPTDAASVDEMTEIQGGRVVDPHQVPEHSSHKGAMIPASSSHSGNSISPEIEFGSHPLDGGSIHPSSSKLAPDKDVIPTKPDELSVMENPSSPTVLDTERSKGLELQLKRESSLDSFPDIVDADPDSD